MASSSSKKIQISIDRGGTFTDCIAIVPDRPEGDIVIKLLSVDPNNYKDAPREGVRRIMEIVEGRTIGRDEKLNTEGIGEYLQEPEREQSAKRADGLIFMPLPLRFAEYIRLSTTVATNALLERKGEKHALITTKGFKVSSAR